MNKTFVSFKESLLPINQISLSDDEMLLVRGGNDGGRNDAGSGAGCGCDCYSGSGCGCHCSSGAGCGCNCSSGAGCVCSGGGGGQAGNGCEGQ